MPNFKNYSISHFTQLNAWQKNHELVIEVYKLTKKFPDDERFGLTSQIRRSASSITANIAEGFGRSHKGDKIRFFHIASGSNSETQNHLILAKDLGYINDIDYNRLKVLVWEGYRLIHGLVASSIKHLSH